MDDDDRQHFGRSREIYDDRLFFFHHLNKVSLVKQVRDRDTKFMDLMQSENCYYYCCETCVDDVQPS